MVHKFWPRHRKLITAATVLSLAAVAAVGAGPVAQAADRPPNPLQKPGWVLDRHDEFDGRLDSGLWITNYLESRTSQARSASAVPAM